MELATGVGRKPPGNCSTWLPGMQLTYLGVKGVTYPACAAGSAWPKESASIRVPTGVPLLAAISKAASGDLQKDRHGDNCAGWRGGVD